MDVEQVNGDSWIASGGVSGLRRRRFIEVSGMW